MGRVVSPTPTPLSSGRVVPALVASYDTHSRAVGLFYTQPTGQAIWRTDTQNIHSEGVIGQFWNLWRSKEIDVAMLCDVGHVLLQTELPRS